MAQVFVKLETLDGVQFVSMVHYQPQDLSEETLATGMLIDHENIPQPDPVRVASQCSASLAYNEAANTFYYVYAPRPLTDQERIKQLEDALKAQADAINTLLGL